MEWTDVTVTRLRQLWSEGHSTAEIGRRLGCSKNAVVGKVHRLDLPARPSPIRPAGSGKPRATPRLRCPRLAVLMPLRSVPTEPWDRLPAGLRFRVAAGNDNKVSLYSTDEPATATARDSELSTC